MRPRPSTPRTPFPETTQRDEDLSSSDASSSSSEDERDDGARLDGAASASDAAAAEGRSAGDDALAKMRDAWAARGRRLRESMRVRSDSNARDGDVIVETTSGVASRRLPCVSALDDRTTAEEGDCPLHSASASEAARARSRAAAAEALRAAIEAEMAATAARSAETERTLEEARRATFARLDAESAAAQARAEAAGAANAVNAESEVESEPERATETLDIGRGANAMLAAQLEESTRREAVRRRAAAERETAYAAAARRAVAGARIARATVRYYRERVLPERRAREDAAATILQRYAKAAAARRRAARARVTREACRVAALALEDAAQTGSAADVHAAVKAAEALGLVDEAMAAEVALSGRLDEALEVLRDAAANGDAKDAASAIARVRALGGVDARAGMDARERASTSAASTSARAAAAARDAESTFRGRAAAAEEALRVAAARDPPDSEEMSLAAAEATRLGAAETVEAALAAWARRGEEARRRLEDAAEDAVGGDDPDDEARARRRLDDAAKDAAAFGPEFARVAAEVRDAALAERETRRRNAAALVGAFASRMTSSAASGGGGSTYEYDGAPRGPAKDTSAASSVASAPYKYFRAAIAEAVAESRARGAGRLVWAPAQWTRRPTERTFSAFSGFAANPSRASPAWSDAGIVDEWDEAARARVAEAEALAEAEAEASARADAASGRTLRDGTRPGGPPGALTARTANGAVSLTAATVEANLRVASSSTASAKTLDLAMENVGDVLALPRLCPDLRGLGLDDNALASLRGADGAPRLERLFARRNVVRGFADVRFSNLAALTLDGNPLETLEGLRDAAPRLEAFSARACGLDVAAVASLSATTGGGLAALTTLRLGGNPLGARGVAALVGAAGFPALLSLDVSRTRAVALDGLELCPRLGALDASENKITRLPESFRPWTPTPGRPTSRARNAGGAHAALRELRLDGNRLEEIPDLWLPCLTRLLARDNRVRRVGRLDGAPNLVELDLSFNRVGADPSSPPIRAAAFVASAPALRIARLNDNPVASAEGYPEALFPFLLELREMDNRAVTEEDVAAAADALARRNDEDLTGGRRDETPSPASEIDSPPSPEEVAFETFDAEAAEKADRASAEAAVTLGRRRATAGAVSVIPWTTLRGLSMESAARTIRDAARAGDDASGDSRDGRVDPQRPSRAFGTDGHSTIGAAAAAMFEAAPPPPGRVPEPECSTDDEGPFDVLEARWAREAWRAATAAAVDAGVAAAAANDWRLADGPSAPEPASEAMRVATREALDAATRRLAEYDPRQHRDAATSRAEERERREELIAAATKLQARWRGKRARNEAARRKAEAREAARLEAERIEEARIRAEAAEAARIRAEAAEAARIRAEAAEAARIRAEAVKARAEAARARIGAAVAIQAALRGWFVRRRFARAKAAARINSDSDDGESYAGVDENYYAPPPDLDLEIDLEFASAPVARESEGAFGARGGGTSRSAASASPAGSSAGSHDRGLHVSSGGGGGIRRLARELEAAASDWGFRDTGLAAEAFYRNRAKALQRERRRMKEREMRDPMKRVARFQRVAAATKSASERSAKPMSASRWAPAEEGRGAR